MSALLRQMNSGRHSAGARLARRALPCLLLGVLATTPSDASASIFGEENATLGAILSQNIAQVARLSRTVEGVFKQIQRLDRMVTQGETVLRRTKDPQGVLRLLNYTQSSTRAVNRIGADAKRIGYRLELIDKEREEVFGKVDDVPANKMREKARGWNDTLKESSSAAMKAQSTVGTLEARGESSRHILEQSESGTGVVEQLQSVVRALNLLHADLAALETNLAAGQRVTATMASVDAAEEDRSAETSKRLLENYTERGAPSQVLQELP